ncbi:hypothetical protein [Deinococcus radiodurans]|uniref:hypothetical protein n=1 Tax=Deinococcus radiodurans TaxID=1299 RepID=UPI000B17AD39|nr:hypothetical protein [Deinococcus radiodurans]
MHFKPTFEVMETKSMQWNRTAPTSGRVMSELKAEQQPATISPAELRKVRAAIKAAVAQAK